VVIDNYAAHTKQEVRDWLDENPRIRAHFTRTPCIVDEHGSDLVRQHRTPSHPPRHLRQRPRTHHREPKRDELFGDDAVKFLVDLRNYSMHYAIPLSSSGTTVSWGGGAPVNQENSVRLSRAELLKWDGWKSASRRHIESHEGDIEFLPAIADYSTKVREFYAWFWDQVNTEVRMELDEYHGKKNEYGLWRRVESTFSHFGPDGRSVYKPRLAAARLERAAYGTKGWRVFTPDETGEWAVGESDWGPLPEGPR
jgi:hypothetical protein